MKWLTTDDIELNTIDAEDPEISDYHMLPNTEKLSDRYKSDIVFPLYVIFRLADLTAWFCSQKFWSNVIVRLADLAAWFCSQKFWSKFSCWVIKSNRAGEVCFFFKLRKRVTIFFFYVMFCFHWYRLKSCLQEGDDIPTDFTKLFDKELFQMDNNVLPKTLKLVLIYCIHISRRFLVLLRKTNDKCRKENPKEFHRINIRPFTSVCCLLCRV